MMQPVPFSQRGRRAPAAMAKLVTGAALIALLSGSLIQSVAAQDDTIVLSAGGSTLTVSPGYADAVSAVAEAHAGPGFAETIAAGARAVADSDCGAMTEASAALAVARPDEGAMTVAEGGAVLSEDDESLAVSDPDTFAEQLTAEILAENEALQMIEGEGGDGANDPVTALASNRKDGKEVRKITPENCPKEEKEAPPVYEEPVYEEPVYEAPVVYEVPSTGTGALGSATLASLFAASSAAAAFGAFALRKREDLEGVVTETLGVRR